jgi:DNA-binding response OmpR family regulator
VGQAARYRAASATTKAHLHHKVCFSDRPDATTPELLMRLLLVEDDRMIGESLRAALRLEGHAVDWVRDAAAAGSTLASERFDLVLLDLGLPASGAPGAPADPAGGLAVLRAARARQDATPFIVLTARDGPGDKVMGLDAGADDYLVKPFELDELGAAREGPSRRCRSVVSRSTRRRDRSRRRACPCCSRHVNSPCSRR